MADADPRPDLGDVPVAVVDTHHRRLSAIWLLPLVAILIGIWLIYRTLSETGPEITIDFSTAEGIEAGKTWVKYRDVNIGKVAGVRFAEDLSQVEVTVKMAPEAKNYLNESARFWVVRPRLGAGEISGLSTLVSGTYVAMEPGKPDKEGKPVRHFIGLEKPPALTAGKKGAIYHLRADQLGSLNTGSPVYFRQIKVGEVVDFQLADDHSHVDISVFIGAPHHRYVRPTTRFWNAGGVGLTLGASGFQVALGSVASLLSGGIAFATPLVAESAKPAPPDTVFTLYESQAKSEEAPTTPSFLYIARFDDSVRGLSVGAPVEFRGVRVGEVRDIQLRADPATGDIDIPVVLAIHVGPGFGAEELPGRPGVEVQRRQQLRLETLVKKGLRAQLRTGNLLTGQLFVDLDMAAKAAPAALVYGGTHPELPTRPGLLSGLADAAEALLIRLDNLPIEATLDNIRALTQSTRHLVDTLDSRAPGLVDDMAKTTGDVRVMLKTATAALATLESTAAADGELGTQVHDTLVEVRAAARALRLMTDYLERHPEALLKGKQGRQ